MACYHAYNNNICLLYVFNRISYPLLKKCFFFEFKKNVLYGCKLLLNKQNMINTVIIRMNKLFSNYTGWITKMEYLTNIKNKKRYIFEIVSDCI